MHLLPILGRREKAEAPGNRAIIHVSRRDRNGNSRRSDRRLRRETKQQGIPALGEHGERPESTHRGKQSHEDGVSQLHGQRIMEATGALDTPSHRNEAKKKKRKMEQMQAQGLVHSLSSWAWSFCPCTCLPPHTPMMNDD